MRSIVLFFALGLAASGCGGSAITPHAVAPSWAKRSLDQEPDVVVALDVRALEADPFFGKVVASLWTEVPRPYDPLLGASRVDLFATVGKTFSAVIHGVGAPPPEVVRCFWPNGPTVEGVYPPQDKGGPWLAASSGTWVVSSAQTVGAPPDPVSMDGDTIFEAWLGPAAVDDGMRRARWDGTWSHLYALRLQVKGGATPGLEMDARFETSVDAEHAEYDLARLRRYVERVSGELEDSELTRLALDQVPQVRVSRSGVDVRVSYRATPELTRYALDKLTERKVRSERDARVCAERTATE